MPIDVTVPGRAGRRRGGIKVHSAATLRAVDRAIVRGIPSTNAARTLLDLSDVVEPRALRRAVEKAEILRIFDAGAIADALGSARGRRGAPILRGLLDERAVGCSVTRSELEERFLTLCDTAAIAAPRVNHSLAVAGVFVEADFVWRAERLIVEADGHRFHSTRRAFEHDRERDRRLLVAGWRVFRCTWRQITEEPDEIAASIQTLLGETHA
jgi:very-short-patch-repair endonuclease